MNREDMIEINERLNLPSSDSKDFREFVEEYDEREYHRRCTKTAEGCLIFFAKKGDLKNVKRALAQSSIDGSRVGKKGATNLNYAIRAAASNHRITVIDYLLGIMNENSSEEERIRSWTFGLEGAAKGGYVDLIEFFLEKGVTKTLRTFELAAREGSPEVLKFFDYNTRKKRISGLVGAARGGHLEQVKYFFSKLPDEDPDWTFVEAAKGGYK